MFSSWAVYLIPRLPEDPVIGRVMKVLSKSVDKLFKDLLSLDLK